MTEAPRTGALTAVRHSTVLLVAGALVLTGCGGDGAGAVSDALEASREAGSGRFEATTETRTGEQVASSTTSGMFSDTALRMEVTTRSPGRGGSALQVRQVDGSLYLSGVPGLAAGQWIQAPLEDLDAAIGSAGGNDPVQRLALLEQVTDDVERVGQEEVGGVEAVHYAASIDLEGAKQELSQEQGGGGNAAQLQMLGLSTIPVDVYVGPDGLVVRMVTTFETTVQGRTSAATLTADFSDWGTEVDVEVPEGALPISETAPPVPTATLAP